MISWARIDSQQSSRGRDRRRRRSSVGQTATIAAALAALVALAACGKKDKDAGERGSAAAGGSAAALAEQPVTCPPGNAVKDGACVAVVTPEKIAAVAQQRSRIDELARQLDQIDAVSAPIDLMGAFRQLDPWKALAANNDRLKTFDEIVAALDNAVKVLRTFKAGLGQTAAQLGNLQGLLDQLLKDTGAPARIEQVRAQVSSQIRATVKTFADDVTQTIQSGLAPLELRFDDASNLVTLGCAALALGRAGDQARQLCDRASASFATAKKYLADVKARPAAVFEDVTGRIETELASLIDDQTKQLLDTAQAAVNEALRLPAAGGSAAPAGAAGSAAPAAAGSAAPR
jgi:hypothetical protein